MKKGLFLIIIAIASLIILALVLPGCSQVNAKIEQIKPEIRGVTLEWGSVTQETTEIMATIKVYNPNPIALTVKKIDYVLNMDGIELGKAVTPGLQIEKKAEFPVKISAKIDNTKIPLFWAEHIKRVEKSEANIEINATFGLNVGDFTFPFKSNQPLVTDLLSSLNKVGPVPVEKKVKIPLVGEKTVFKISLDSLSGKWGKITPDTTQINLSAIINNENPYPLVVPKMEYKADINGIPLGSGESGLQFACKPHSKGDVNVAIGLNTGLMNKWFVTHIQQGEKSTFNMSVALVFDVPGVDKYSIPIWEGSQSIQTDILGKAR